MAEMGRAMIATSQTMRDIREIMRERRSTRVAFDPRRPVPETDVCAILEAARWAPTAHNMQNFEILVVDDPSMLAAIGRIRTETSQEFVRENYVQLSFSPDELRRRGTGLLATMFPIAWRSPHALSGDTAEFQHGFLDQSMAPCPLVLIVVWDTRMRAPASENDFLGAMSLGCVMENMWLAAEALGIGFQIMSVFSGPAPEKELHRVFHLPDHMKIAFACRLGYPANPVPPYLRVRRAIGTFVHHNVFGNLRRA
jgi:nitroreductase